MSNAVFGNQCLNTPAQTEGPFYPINDQADKDWDLTIVTGKRNPAKGQIILIEGIVQDSQCQPINNAIVEVWQACVSGRYNHPGDSNPALLDPNFQYWGRSITSQKGQYHLKTIIPGDYPASNTWTRPGHIHFKIQKRGYHELTTQMYFKGNELNQTDYILNGLSEQEREKVIVEFKTPINSRGERANSLVGNFSITMRQV